MAPYSDKVAAVNQPGYGVPEGATLKSITRVFRISREHSVARHNADLTRRHVKRKAMRSVRFHPSTIGLVGVSAVLIVQGVRSLAGG